MMRAVAAAQAEYEAHCNPSQEHNASVTLDGQDGLPPRRASLVIPARPLSANRLRQRESVLGCISNFAAKSLLFLSSAAKRTILARRTSLAATLRIPAQRSRTCRSSSDNMIRGARLISVLETNAMLGQLPSLLNTRLPRIGKSRPALPEHTTRWHTLRPHPFILLIAKRPRFRAFDGQEIQNSQIF
jgi:hypothetical protein